MKKLKIGDKVHWRGNWGMGKPEVAVVESIEVTKGGKEGDSVCEILWSKMYNRNVVVVLDNGHWAYAEQITKCTNN